MTDLFSFQEVIENEIWKEIPKLDGSNANPVGGIPTEMLQLSFLFLTKITSSSCWNDYFPDELKAAEVTPILTKSNDSDKKNFRHVSVLPHLSKVFERVMYIQTESFMECKLSKLLTGFRKNHSSQHCVANMLGKRKNTS